MSGVRVLVVDDSAFARKVVRQILTAAPGVEVVDIARDGLEALEKIAHHKPDVVTLDLVMPNLDGLGVLRAAQQQAGGPRFVVVSISGSDSALGLEALELGAVDVVQKPTALASDRLYEIGRELVSKVVGAARARAPSGGAAAVVPMLGRAPKIEVLLIGASTGGPPAIGRLIAALPADFPVPILVVVHLPAEYTDPFARRLDNPQGLRVREAADGMPIVGGSVTIARGGVHLELARDRKAGLAARLTLAPLDLVHRPAVDVLFQSAARVLGPKALGVVLTGMGDDGVAGALALKKSGATVLTEAESSCVVYGMPRAVVAAGASDAEVPLERLAAEIVRRT